MRYRVFETMLNEYTDAVHEGKLGQVEAASEAEALASARLMYPNHPGLSVKKEEGAN